MAAEKTNNIPEVKCPHCGAVSKDKKIYNYGSPFVKCHKCNVEYFDKRFHEIALDGIREEDRMTVKDSMLMFGIGVVMTAVCVLINWFTSTHIGRIWTVFIFFTILGVFLIGYGVVKFFTTITGGEKRKWEKLTEESKKRVSDPAYMMKLRDSEYEMSEM